MAILDDFIVDGIALSGLPGVVLADLNVNAPSIRRSGDIVIPTRNGAYGSQAPLDAFAFTVKTDVLGDSAVSVPAETIENAIVNCEYNLATLIAVCTGTRGIVTLTSRRQAIGGYRDLTANGRFSSGSPTVIHPGKVSVDLEFVNLDGCWYSGYVTTAPGSITVGGCYRTHRIELTLPSAGVLSNATTGHYVSVTSGAVLNVGEFTTSGDISDIQFSPVDSSWFALDCGVNVVSWSGAGTPTIKYSYATV